MEGELDIVTAVCAICVAAYVAIAIGYVAHFDLGFSIQQIRGAALAIAVLVAHSLPSISLAKSWVKPKVLEEGTATAL
jgi:hypothetical protein